jgi:hypothetical protein
VPSVSFTNTSVEAATSLASDFDSCMRISFSHICFAVVNRTSGLACVLPTDVISMKGLSHAYLLLWLQDIVRPVEIDDIISAEILDINTNPVLINH